jgi:hypothetical protein
MTETDEHERRGFGLAVAKRGTNTPDAARDDLHAMRYISCLYDARQRRRLFEPFTLSSEFKVAFTLPLKRQPETLSSFASVLPGERAQCISSGCDDSARRRSRLWGSQSLPKDGFLWDRLLTPASARNTTRPRFSAPKLIRVGCPVA